MSVITATPTGQLALTELKLSLREKVGPIWGLAFPIVARPCFPRRWPAG